MANRLSFLPCFTQASTFTQGWVVGRAIGLCPGNFAGKEPYVFLQMAFWICPVFARMIHHTASEWLRLCLWHHNQQDQLGSAQNIPSLWQWASYLMETEVGHLGVSSSLSCCCCQILQVEGVKKRRYMLSFLKVLPAFAVISWVCSPFTATDR